jgi:hypothetical protein
MRPAARHRPQAPRADLPRAQPLKKRAAALEARVRGPWRSGIHRKRLSESEALEKKVAELERFCGKLALENEILKRGLSRHHWGGGTP